MEIRRIRVISPLKHVSEARPTPALRILAISDMEIKDSPALHRIDAELSCGNYHLVVSCGDVHAGIIEHIATTVPVIGVRGNHDSPQLPAGMRDLHCRMITYNGVKFGGFQGAWKYKPTGHFLYENDEVERYLSRFPGLDVFVAHNPMSGIHDVNDGVHNGFEAFRNYCMRTQPGLFLHGHSGIQGETALGSTIVMGINGVKGIEIELV